MECTVFDIVEFYAKHPEFIGELQVHTRVGYRDIEYADCTAKDSELYKITLQNKLSLIGSPDHLLFMTDWHNPAWCKIKNLKVGEYIICNDPKYVIDASKIIKIEKLDYKMDLYDLQVADVKEYYANGMRSHNSTILDALTFGLYGKSFRGTKKEYLVNTINKKNCLVEIKFKNNGHQYLIRRGIKKTIFEIWVDGTMINQDAKSYDYQKLLEETILKINYKTFIQVVILGSANYIPFMKLSSSSRREIVEDILGINIFSDMNVKLKDEYNINQALILKCDGDIKVVSSKILAQQKIIDTISSNKQDHINSLINEIAQFAKNKITNDKKASDLQSRIKECKIEENQISYLFDNIQKLNTSISYNTKIVKGNASKVKNLEKIDICDACGQEVTHEYRLTYIDNIKKTSLAMLDENTLANKRLLEMQNNYNELINSVRELKELQTNITSLLTNNQQIEKTIEQKQKQLKELENKQKQEIGSEQNVIDDLKLQGNQLLDEKKDLKDIQQLMEYSLILLKDTGIKTSIISDYIESINQIVNFYLNKFECYFSFEFDVYFNELIKSRFRDEFEYASLSQGEQLRVNLSIMLAWRKICISKNVSSTNLLILDEIMDSSMDADGVESMINILKELEHDTNIFILTPNGSNIKDKFRNIIEVKKVNDFTTLTTLQNI